MRLALLFCSMVIVLAAGPLCGQEIAVLEGIVVDDVTGAPIPDCNVSVRGLAIGTTTDATGTFRLSGLPPGPVALVASHVGFARREVQVVIPAPMAGIEIRLSPRPVMAPLVTVTATRAQDRRSPVPFATIGSDEIEARYHAQDIPVLLTELSSTTSYSESGNGIGYNYISIRGFDQRRISVLINGVPQNDPEDHNVYWVDFPDLLANVEDIQVQRGSGSAFYGPAAIGGSVNIITSAFSVEPRVSVTAGGGTYDTRRVSVAASSGLLKDEYVLQARLSRIRTNGYRDRSWSDLTSYFMGGARVGKRSIMRLNVYGGPIEDHLAYAGLSRDEAEDPELRRTNPIRRPDEIENFNQPHGEISHEIHLSESWTVANTLFGIRGYGSFDYDGSWAPMSYYRLTPEYGFDVAGDPDDAYVDSLLARAYVDNRQVGWLPQVRWRKGPAELVFGAELRRHRSLHWGRIQEGDSDLPPAMADTAGGDGYVGERRYYEYRGAKDVLSPHAHAVWEARPDVFVTADLQYARIRYRLHDEAFIGTDFAVTYDFLNPRVGVNWNADEHLNLFASYARTSREPRLKNLYDAGEASTPSSWGPVTPQFELEEDGTYDFSRPLVQPEVLDDFEIGASMSGAAARVGVNVYYMDFHDEIVKKGRLDRFGQPVTGNAERTVHGGVEITGAVEPTSRLALSGNLSLSRNEIVDDTAFLPDGTPVSLDGNTIGGFPEVLANLRATWTQKGFTGSLLLQHVGRQYTDNFESGENSVDARTVFHGSAGYAFPENSSLAGLSLRLHVQNIFNTLYVAYGIGDKFFPAAERAVFAGVTYER